MKEQRTQAEGAKEEPLFRGDCEYEVVEIEILPARIVCPDCGGITTEGLDFCDKCGGVLN